MSFNPDFEQQELIAESMRRSGFALTDRERLAELIVGSTFVAAVAALLVFAPPHALSVLPALLCIALLAVAARVEFDTPFGFTVATQLAYVPLVFALPVSLAPPAVVLGLVLAELPEVRRGRTRPARLVTRLGNAWFAVGPAAVFAVAGTAPRHAGPLLLIAALAAQFLVDLVIPALRYWISQAASVRALLRSSWVYLIDLSLCGVGLAVAEEVHSSGYAPLAVLPLLGLLAVFAREREARLDQLIELNDAYRGTALVLGDVVEADDGYTGEHSKGVVRLCLDVAELLGLNAEQRRNLEFGALLHDVGKIAIPKEIINKPGKLDEREWTIIKTHTIEGQKLLDTVGGFMHEVGMIVRSHHERWDGGGYPDALAGEQIPLESRIVSACDTWNAMRTDRSYRKALSFEVAETEMRAIAGSQLDPRVVEVLLVAVDGERRLHPGPGPSRTLVTS
ncbi:MAG: HD-GYP domain-containing protein [Solirubrobacteraceae bacterium]